MKKGLRRTAAHRLQPDDVLKTCPDEEGIKTLARLRLAAVPV